MTEWMPSSKGKTIGNQIPVLIVSLRAGWMDQEHIQPINHRQIEELIVTSNKQGYISNKWKIKNVSKPDTCKREDGH